MIIIGAGLAGMLAAHAFPNAEIFESRSSSLGVEAEHKALLRFRSEAVSHLTGIPFKKVLVRKGVWYRGWFHEPNIALANMYAQKCLERLVGDRSIWNTAAAERYIAPENLYDQLLDRVENRVQWGMPIKGLSPQEQYVSTMPLNVAARLAGIAVDHNAFHHKQIHVRRFRLRGCDVYQTIYFPDPELPLYRASITGDLLICEFTHEVMLTTKVLDRILQAFALTTRVCVDELESVSQRYGKIAPIDEHLRKTLIWKLTEEHNLFSLGRFATWRNILLDDVVHDISVVRQLITATNYERRMKQK